MRSYPVKENHISSAISEILRYKVTDRQTNILLLYNKDLNILGSLQGVREGAEMDGGELFVS